MAGKRKRKGAPKSDPDQSWKRTKCNVPSISENVPIRHPTLCLYYTRVMTLQEYLLSKISRSSARRHDKVASIGRRLQKPHAVPQIVSESNRKEVLSLSSEHVERHCEIPDREKNLAKLLKTTLIGLLHDTHPDVAASRQKDFTYFSQQVGSISGSSVGGTSATMSEVGSSYI